MSSSPDPHEILAAAAHLVRGELLPALSGELAFKVRLLANALDLLGRQWTQQRPAGTEAPTSDEKQRLLALTGTADDPAAELVRRIEAGTIAADDPALIDHLWRTTLSRIAVDQPRYASYLAETGHA